MTSSERTFSDPLVALPAQPPDLPWPDETWPEGEPPAGASAELGRLLDAAFDTAGPLATTHAVVVVHRGRLVAERYDGELERWDGPDEVVTADTALLSWSMAKSMLHAVVGMLVGESRLAVDAPAAVPQWSAPDDPRRAITLDHLLAMRDGLDFAEDYVDSTRSDVIEMLFGGGKDDVAAFAADRPLAAAPGERFNYSSGTTNIVSGVVAREIGPGRPYEDFVAERLFGAIGARSARATFDAAGTWVASSYAYATARDFARFGLLYLRDGVWNDQRLLSPGWVDYARRPRSTDPEDGSLYGSHWWVAGDDYGTFSAKGYEGQSILVCPGLDLVAVRLGKTAAEHYPDLTEWRRQLVAAFAP